MPPVITQDDLNADIARRIKAGLPKDQAIEAASRQQKHDKKIAAAKAAAKAAK